MDFTLALQIGGLIVSLLLSILLVKAVPRLKGTKKDRLFVFLLLSIMLVIPILIKWYLGGAKVSGLIGFAVIALFPLLIAAFVSFRFPFKGNEAFPKDSIYQQVILQIVSVVFVGFYTSDVMGLFERLNVPSYIRSTISICFSTALIVFAVYVMYKKRQLKNNP